MREQSAPSSVFIGTMRLYCRAVVSNLCVGLRHKTNLKNRETINIDRKTEKNYLCKAELH